MAKRKPAKKITKPPPNKPSTSKAINTTTKALNSVPNRTKKPTFKARSNLPELSDNKPETQTQTQALPPCPDDSQVPPKLVEYGIQFAITYDDKVILDTTKFYTLIDQSVLFDLKILEKDAIHNASTKQGRTTHSTRLWHAIVAHAKQRPKPRMMFTIVSEWLELLKLVNIYLIKGGMIVLQIKLR
jgi:hypothetical protein